MWLSYSSFLLLCRYQRANAVRFQSNSACLGLCMLNHYCAITRLDYDEFRLCLDSEQLPLGQAGAAMLTPLLALLLPLLRLPLLLN